MDIPQLENLPEDGKKGENHFSIFVYPFEHGLAFKERHDFLNNARFAGWRPWVWRLEDGVELSELPVMLKTWFHPPTLEALYPDAHRLLHCRNYYRDACAHCGKDPTSAEMEVASLLKQGKTREEILSSLNISPDAVTPAEFDVAALAGDGKSPGQIAERLNESRRSVQFYRRVFRHKVGECTRNVRQTLSSTLFMRAASQADETGELAPFWFEYSPENTLRITFDLKSKGEKEWIFYPSANLNEGIRFGIDWIDAYLFPFGVGFLCIKVRLKGEDARIDRLMDFNQNFRDIDARGKVYRCESRVENEGLNKIEFLGRWLAGLSRHTSGKAREPMQFRLKDYNSRYKIFSFASLQGDDSYWFKDMAGKTGYYKGIDRLDALLYEMATTSSISTLKLQVRKWQPSVEYLQGDLLENNRICLWKYWRGMALKYTAVFLSHAGKDQPWSKQYEDKYFPLYVYVLNLKMQLFQFSNQLNLRRLQGNDKRIRKVLDDFLTFRNEFWFSEISPNFQMEILFNRFKHGLEVETDYQGVSTEVSDIFKYQESRFNRGLNRKVVLLTIGAIVVGFFGMNSLMQEPPEPWKDIWDKGELLWHFFAMLSVGVAILGLLIGAVHGARVLFRRLKDGLLRKQ